MGGDVKIPAQVYSTVHMYTEAIVTGHLPRGRNRDSFLACSASMVSISSWWLVVVGGGGDGRLSEGCGCGV